MGQSQQIAQSPMPPSPAPDSSHNQGSGATKHAPHHTRQPGIQADPVTHHSAQGKDAGPASLRAPQKGHSPQIKDGASPPKTQNHQHAGQPGKKNRVKPSCSSPRANATATPRTLPYFDRGKVKTTNPKHTPPTRNHPADKQTPAQYKAEKPDATAEPGDAHPAATTLSGQSRHAHDNHPNTTTCHTAEGRMQ
ncbi:hypothetical protein CRENBAI_024931 [Crenichthys baileyi]|uniref:Uncharacterized protein n=1 Tax=Crenichthys baileyi TaxID=28760 RepID=A0AAV9R9V4_9TELE